MNTIICVEKINRHMKREFVRRFGTRRSRIWVRRGILVEIKKEIWERR